MLQEMVFLFEVVIRILDFGMPQLLISETKVELNFELDFNEHRIYI